MGQLNRTKMKNLLSIMLMVFSVCSLTALGDDDFRDFEDVEGRIIRGKIVAFDDAQEMVSFQRESDGAVLKVKLNLFSQPDRLYIRDWAFMSNQVKDLKITAKIHRRTLSEGPMDGGMHRVEEAQGYDVLIENNSDRDFGYINVEYCIFYRQGLRNAEGMMYEEGVLYGQASVQMDPGSNQGSFKTQTVDLYNQQTSGNYFGNINDAKGKIGGIWIKARISMPSGDRFSYEYRTSNDPKWKWTEKSGGAGLNADHQ